MNAYLDASALVKRYVSEPGSKTVRAAMDEAGRWYMCRIGYVETARAVKLTGGAAAESRLIAEWPSFQVVEVSSLLTEAARTIAGATGLRSLGALHVAAALEVAADDLVFATWDRKLHAAARAHGLQTLPASLD